MPDNTSWPFNRTWYDNDGEEDLFESYLTELKSEDVKHEKEIKNDEQKT
tara:strand:+ start:163 stop:309 length:147 start_codon:yes stop_codon:yes gene_type:complete